MAETEDEREEELSTTTAIYPELTIDPSDPFTATLELPVAPSAPLLVRFIPQSSETSSIYAEAAVVNGSAYIEHDIKLSHLPPLTLHLSLPDGYPGHFPPRARLTAQRDWLPQSKLLQLQGEVAELWEESGHCQTLYSYIDHLQQAAERGFDLDQSAEGCLVLSAVHESALVSFDRNTKQKVFNAGTFNCGVCLEPKKGSSCYELGKCGHVFCKQCLQDFYVNAITEGDVVNIRCLDPGCGKDVGHTASTLKRKRKSERTLRPHELLAIGIEETVVRRYVEMKRKKKLEADKTTVYCPRTWCQGPARSSKYPPIPADLRTYTGSDSSDESDIEPAKHDYLPSEMSASKAHDPSDRLAQCEKCSLAFCRVCYMGWHGPFARCFPRDPNELSAEEKASYDYIRMNTSPCPTCSSPTQKTMGCNHMKCFQCNTHFCYLCGSWLDGGNPYQHFNKSGTGCFQRLWELEEGDEGQGPEDGRGFAGARAWEQIAAEVAREADEAEAGAQRLQAEGGMGVLEIVPFEDEAPIEVMLAGVQLDEPPVPPQPRPRGGGGRRARNPFHPPAALGANGHGRPPLGVNGQGQAARVRAYERARPRGGGAVPPVRRRPADDHDGNQRQQEELERFLEMARRDEEDGWDSDGLDEDDEAFVIR